MIKLQKKIFTITDAWPWFVVNAIGLGVTFAVFFTHWGAMLAVWPQLLITALVAGAFVFLTGIRYDVREEAIRKWNNAFQTPQGMAVIPNNAAVNSFVCKGFFKSYMDARESNPLYAAIGLEVNNCCYYWNNYKKATTSNAQYNKLESAFYGYTLNIVDKPFEVKFIGKCAGVADITAAQVIFDDNRVATEKQLLMLIRHELSHVCLRALGYPDAIHHQIFVDTGFC